MEEQYKLISRFIEELQHKNRFFVSKEITDKKDKKKAKAVLRNILYELEHGTYIEPRKETFVDFLIDYFNNNVSRDVEATTFAGYISIIDNHIVPYFKDRGYKLQDIKTIDIQGYFNEKYKQGSTKLDEARKSKYTNESICTH